MAKIYVASVLILIVMEYLLWLRKNKSGELEPAGLNPYCYGISSLTVEKDITLDDIINGS